MRKSVEPVKPTIIDSVKDPKALYAALNANGDPNIEWCNLPLLYYAILYDNESADILLDYGAKLDGGTYTALSEVVANNNNSRAVYRLLKLGADPNAVGTTPGLRPLHTAVIMNNISTVDMLLQYGAKVDALITTGDGLTALHFAVRDKHYAIAKLLLKRGADPDFMWESDDTCNALHYAAYGDDVTMIEILLEYGADIELRTKNGMTPLHCAAINNNDWALKLLIAKGANINAVCKTANGRPVLDNSSYTDVVNGFSGLHFALRYTSDETLHTLLLAGADVFVRDSLGRTPRDYASELNDWISMSFLEYAETHGYTDEDRKEDPVERAKLMKKLRGKK